MANLNERAVHSSLIPYEEPKATLSDLFNLLQTTVRLWRESITTLEIDPELTVS
jgi:hypothetical protein